jgi:hypothetical protein
LERKDRSFAPASRSLIQGPSSAGWTSTFDRDVVKTHDARKTIIPISAYGTECVKHGGTEFIESRNRYGDHVGFVG